MGRVPSAAVAYSYVRFSTPTQAGGDSLRRQTEKAAAWCERNHARLDTSTTLHDLGKSAYTGSHRKNPDRHALAAFLKLVEQGRVPKGSALIVESLDRLSREHIRPALSLLLNLIEAGVRVVQLIPVEQVYDEDVEPMQLMMALMELSRGNSESRVKSERVGVAWAKKKQSARDTGEAVTTQVPAWVEMKGGKFRLIPARAAVVKKIFELTAAGYGITQVSRKLTADGVEPLGTSRKWNRSYIDLILRDRRAIGEYRPNRVIDGRRTPEGDPIPNYYPAVVTEAQWHAARAGATDRARLVGRGSGDRVNLFRRMVKSAQDGTSYVECVVNRKGVRSRVLHNSHALEGRGPYYTFPAEAFEAAVLSMLKEINPAEVLGADGPGEAAALAGELAQEDAKIAELEAALEDGDVAALARKLREREARRAELAGRLAEARQREANPLAESWGAVQTLADVLAAAADPTDARLRLRSALRRVVAGVWMLVVPRGAVRTAAVQVFFAGGATRSYLIVHTAAHGPTGRPAAWEVRSFAAPGRDGALDLRDPAQSKRLAAVLGQDKTGGLVSALVAGDREVSTWMFNVVTSESTAGELREMLAAVEERLARLAAGERGR